MTERKTGNKALRGLQMFKKKHPTLIGFICFLMHNNMKAAKWIKQKGEKNWTEGAADESSFIIQ